MGRLAGPWSTILDTAAPGFELDGEEFWLPHRPARVWLRALADGDPEAVIPGLLYPDDVERWAELYWSDDADGRPLVTRGLHEELVNHLITEATGMPWPGALALLGWAGDNWRLLDAEHAQIEPLELPLDRLCNLVYRHVREGQEDDKARARLDQQLFAPPPEAKPADRSTRPPGWDTASQSAMFMAAMGQHRQVTGRRGA